MNKMNTVVTGILAAVLAAGALGAAAGEVSAAARPGFAPGVWVGTGVQKGIFSVTGDDPSPVDGTVRFSLNVSRSFRATGSLVLKTRMEIDRAGLRGVLIGTATTKLTGTGSDVRFAGPLRLEGKLTDGTTTVPFTLTKAVAGRLLVTRPGCTRVVGRTDSQLAFKWTAVPKAGSRPRC